MPARRLRHPLLLAALALLVAAPAARAATPAQVNPFVGTAAGAADFGTGGGAGNTYPGAALPFGMVQFSPDTSPSTTNFAGGYSYEDHRLRGFSLNHFSGAGCAALQDIPFLPTTAALTRSPVVAGSSDLVPEVVPAFDHRHESAAPGDYRVTLNPGRRPIGVQLTATERTGAARIAFPAGATGSVLVNAGGSVMADEDARVAVDPPRREISGSARSGLFCYQPVHYRVYFAARFDRPFAAYGTWTRQRLDRGAHDAHDAQPGATNYTPIPGGPLSLPGNPSTTAQAGAYVSFAPGRRGATPVEVHVGVSYVSVAGARRNLAESLGRPVAAVRAAARARWARALGAVTVHGGRARDRRTFATALYHALLTPSLLSDRDGRYPGMDGRVHRARGREQYTNISGWDIYRGQTQLVAMLDPRRAGDIAASLVADAQQSGCLPRWPYVTAQTNVMTGDPSAPILASTYAFGARGFDAGAALAAMVRGADAPCHTANGDYTEREALDDLLRQGWIGHERNVSGAVHTGAAGRAQPWGSAATTLEDAIADFAIARLAAVRGDRATALRFLARAGGWRALVNPATRAIGPRFSTGAFAPLTGPADGDGFVEGSAAQYAWLVPHDMGGLAISMGGRAAALARLDAFFTEINAGPASAHAFLGNEPGLGTPYVYDWLGRPDRTQAIVRRALLELYAPTPGGLPGNDDGGTMSAWWVFGALGLYPAIPGTDALALASPLFPSATVRLGSGRTLRITAAGAAPGRPYVRALTWRGRPAGATWLRYARLVGGGTLRFALAGAPTAWGSEPGQAPPSYPPPAG